MVWQSKNTPLEERFAAWKEIIETMPDSSFAGYRHFNFKTKQMEPAPRYSPPRFSKEVHPTAEGTADVFTKEGDGTYALEKPGRPLDGRRNQRLVLVRRPVRRYGDVMEDMEMEKGWAALTGMRVQKIINCGSMRTKTSMPNILTLDYDMDARPLRFVYRTISGTGPSIRTSWKNSSPSWKSAFPSLSAEATSFGIPPGSRASPTRRTARPLCWTTSPTGIRRNRQTMGLPLGRSSTSEKGNGEKYESPMQDPPLDYGAYGVSVGKSGQLHQAYNGFACYLDLEPYHGPLEGTFARPEAHQRIHQGEPDGRLAPQQRAGVAHTSPGGNAPCPSLSPLL